MSCFSWACFYKSRVVVVALSSIGEAALFCYRVTQFDGFSLSSDGNQFNYTFNFSDPAQVGFLLDTISSITALFTTVFTILVLLCAIMALNCMCAFSQSCSCSCLRFFNRDHFRGLQRCLSLNCNCPCYRARPSLRFRLRFLFLLICLTLRSVAVYMYSSVSEDDVRNENMFLTCLGSLSFLIVTLLLDIHHYTVWWCYTPANDTTYFGRSWKHKRYIPYHLVGDEHQKNILGDRPCTTDPCYNRDLSHVVVFHGKNYKPQPRWRDLDKYDTNGTYIGFHTTTPQAAVSIVHSEFRSSPHGMLGKGVYFARSIADTIGKAQSEGGACIIAKIRMGKVYEFNKETVYPVRNNPFYDADVAEFVLSSDWHDEYDTCYMNHPEDNKDEFCIKDPVTQIIKWVVVVDRDSKVRRYGLDTEFDSTQCFCV